MTRGHLIFLVLMICSATMIGATMGLASNFDTLVERSQFVSNAAVAATVEPAAEKNTGDANESFDPITGIHNIDQVSRSSHLMLVTNQDEEEIRKMLLVLGMANDEQTTDFISNFQRDHGLSATGGLDAETLKLMIQEAAYNIASSPPTEDNSTHQ